MLEMFKIVKDSKSVNKMYTIHGYVGDPKLKNDRYIQRSAWTGEPIINTRCAYMAGRVVCFENREQANMFLDKFVSHPDRKNKYDIDWRIIEYRPSLVDGWGLVFKETDSKYGTYCRLYKSGPVERL